MILHFIRELTTSVIDLIYPPTCPGCFQELEEPGQIVCSACENTIQPLTPPFCTRCGYPQPNDPLIPYKPSCHECPPDPIGFDTARSVFSYEDERMRNIIHALKYHYQRRVADWLGEQLRLGYETYFLQESFDAIVPVPLHKKRLRQREFNQAVLIGEILSREGNIPLREDLIARVRMTPPQVRLSPKQRAENVKGAFKCFSGTEVKNLRILLVDDVYTTGSTANEVSRTLKEAGAEHVSALTVARALK